MSVRRLRSDAEANRARILEVAAAAFRSMGTRVPMATIAERAEVGVGTLYRHFPDREHLLAALEQHSYELTLGLAGEAAQRSETGLESLRFYLDAIIHNRDRLFLPLHGGPMSSDQSSVGLRQAIAANIAAILDRGHRDGSIRADAVPLDVVIGGTFLCMPLPNTSNWDEIAERQLQIFLDGLRPPSAHR
jgi:AcrR family transcriptional regulator